MFRLLALVLQWFDWGPGRSENTPYPFKAYSTVDTRALVAQERQTNTMKVSSHSTVAAPSFTEDKPPHPTARWVGASRIYSSTLPPHRRSAIAGVEGFENTSGEAPLVTQTNMYRSCVCLLLEGQIDTTSIHLAPFRPVQFR